MLHQRFSMIALSLALAAAPLPAADLIVGPGGFATLQAALDAAAPGDRILLRTNVLGAQFVIRTSVTIEPEGPGRQRITVLHGGGTGTILIDSLAAGIPLTFRRLDVAFVEGFSIGATMGFRTASAGVPGEIRFDDVHATWEAGPGYSQFGHGVMARLQTNRVWLRGCTFEAFDLRANNGCMDLDGVNGTSCLDLTAANLIMEDCTLRAASANHLAYACCFGTPPGCTGQTPFGGRGGFALRAATQDTVLVRCSLSDGNGGTVEAGPWIPTPSAGTAQPSMLVATTGDLHAFDVTHQFAQPGRIGSAYTTRGVLNTLGGPAPLQTGGPGAIGTRLDVTLQSNPGELSLFTVGFAWQRTRTPVGDHLIAPFTVLVHPGGGTTLSYAIPALPALRGLPLLTQAVQIFPAMAVGNPSGLATR